ncbi:MAG: hypothetical protein Q9M34_04300 [Sulfurimonas sp.]|nr:hypothetical protein [Sulfurimonas sp.]
MKINQLTFINEQRITLWKQVGSIIQNIYKLIDSFEKKNLKYIFFLVLGLIEGVFSRHAQAVSYKLFNSLLYKEDTYA